MADTPAEAAHAATGAPRNADTAPDHYLGGATLNEDYRDEKHRDATS